MAGPLRVLLVEDHELVRAGLRRLVQRAADIVVAGDAADGAGALRMVARLAAAGASTSC